MNTLRQPPSHGDNTDALRIEPRKNPSAIAMVTNPFANPNWAFGNHCPIVLMPFRNTKGMNAPTKTTETSNKPKFGAKPLAAANNPTPKVLTINTFFGPNLSPKDPPKRLVTIAGSEPIPHKMPICTTFRFNSCAISFDNTDMAIEGMARMTIFVIKMRVNRYHLYLLLCVSI